MLTQAKVLLGEWAVWGDDLGPCCKKAATVGVELPIVHAAAVLQRVGVLHLNYHIQNFDAIGREEHQMPWGSLKSTSSSWLLVIHELRELPSRS